MTSDSHLSKTGASGQEGLFPWAAGASGWELSLLQRELRREAILYPPRKRWEGLSAAALVPGKPLSRRVGSEGGSARNCLRKTHTIVDGDGCPAYARRLTQGCRCSVRVCAPEGTGVVSSLNTYGN